MAAKRHDGCFLKHQHGRADLLRSHGRIPTTLLLTPFGYRLWVDPMPRCQCVQARLAMLYCSTHASVVRALSHSSSFRGWL